MPHTIANAAATIALFELIAVSATVCALSTGLLASTTTAIPSITPITAIIVIRRMNTFFIPLFPLFNSFSIGFSCYSTKISLVPYTKDSLLRSFYLSHYHRCINIVAHQLIVRINIYFTHTSSLVIMYMCNWLPCRTTLDVSPGIIPCSLGPIVLRRQLSLSVPLVLCTLYTIILFSTTRLFHLYYIFNFFVLFSVFSTNKV